MIISGSDVTVLSDNDSMRLEGWFDPVLALE